MARQPVMISAAWTGVRAAVGTMRSTSAPTRIASGAISASWTAIPPPNQNATDRSAGQGAALSTR